jgi:hypothetical protein
MDLREGDLQEVLRSFSVSGQPEEITKETRRDLPVERLERRSAPVYISLHQLFDRGRSRAGRLIHARDS